MKKLIIIFPLLCVLLFSCKKFTDAGLPPTQLTSAAVFTTDKTATAALLAIYSQMEQDQVPYRMITSTGLLSDELVNYSAASTDVELFANNLLPTNSLILQIWRNYYKYIYQANAVLEGAGSSTTLSDAVKKQLRGESLFIRAFCHFYLLRFFGDVPIMSSTNYEVNAVQPRNSAADVYTFIINNLNESKELLAPEYLNGSNVTSTERVRPNKFSAIALLARVQLYKGEWPAAESAATEVLNQTSNYQLLSNLNNVFLKNSLESIWQLQAIVPGYNTTAGASLILAGVPSYVSLDTNFLKCFVPTDLRRSNWINSVTVAGRPYFYPFKYKVGYQSPSVTEYTMVMRLSEQLLIRAEARAHQGNVSGAQADCNLIRSRAGLSTISGLTQTQVLDSIQLERRRELFCEFGDRWLNLRRTGTINSILGTTKGSNWVPTDELLPVPVTEILRNPALTQNNGY